MVYAVGLIGNIGSGKTTVANFFKKRDIEIINADEIARFLIKKNTPAAKEIINHFGDNILTLCGEIDRKKLRTIIFNDLKEKKWLENLLHPLIRTIIQEKVSISKSPYCIIEIPLLPRRESYPYIKDYLWVKSPLETQIMRIMERDNEAKLHAENILSQQAHLEEFASLATFTIDNDDTLENLEIQVQNLHWKFIKKSKDLDSD